MRSASSHLSLVPDCDVTVHIVLDDLGELGGIYRETDETEADLDSVVDDIISGQFENLKRVVAFNTMRCATLCAIMRWKAWLIRMRFSLSMRLDF